MMRSLNLGVQRPKKFGLRSKFAVSAFKLQVGVADIPHPDKASRGGEDAYFFCDTAMGIADGVGGWADSGVNPKDYSQGLMDVAKAYYLEPSPQGSDVDVVEAMEQETVIDDSGASYAEPASASAPRSSMEALKRAHAETQKPGSSTACIVQIDLDTGVLDSANLGDSGFMVVRDGQVVLKSEFQEHFFDCPFQLASLRFVPETDQATDAAVLTGQVQTGDLIILGSDGLFDNVPDEDILLVVRSVEAERGPGESSSSKANEIATALGELAFSNSQDPAYESPYALEARRQGFELSFFEKLQTATFTNGGLQLGQITGGKMDDVTVLVGLVEEA